MHIHIHTCTYTYIHAHIYTHMKTCLDRVDVLRKNARAEFEQARYEADRLVVARMLFVGNIHVNIHRYMYIIA